MSVKVETGSIDDIIKAHEAYLGILAPRARNQLSALRQRITKLEAENKQLNEQLKIYQQIAPEITMSALDEVIRAYWRTDHYDNTEAKAHAELTALREKTAKWDALITQVEQAKGLIIRSGRVINNLKSPDATYDLLDDLKAWLDTFQALSAVESETDSS